MRLIDADILKKYMTDNGRDVKRFLGYIDEQPTAYDLDKVAERLSCNECESCELRDVCNANMLDGFMEKICEIVKGGGIDG